MLKSLKYSWKQIITLGLVLICFSALAYCLFKVTHTLLTRPISQYNTNKWSSKNPAKAFIPRTTLTKDMFFLTINDFLPLTNQANLLKGNTYFVIKTIESNTSSSPDLTAVSTFTPNSQCLFGIFQLIKKTPSQFNFHVLNTFPGKKIEQYALLTSQKLKYSILEKEQLPTKILNCKNWLSVENSYNIFTQKNLHIDETNILTFSKSKCTPLASANILALKSDTPNIAYFDYDTIENKVHLCIKKPGNAIIHTMTLNSAKFQTQYLKIQPAHK